MDAVVPAILVAATCVSYAFGKRKQSGGGASALLDEKNHFYYGDISTLKTALEEAFRVRGVPIALSLFLGQGGSGYVVGDYHRALKLTSSSSSNEVNILQKVKGKPWALQPMDPPPFTVKLEVGRSKAQKDITVITTERLDGRDMDKVDFVTANQLLWRAIRILQLRIGFHDLNLVLGDNHDRNYFVMMKDDDVSGKCWLTGIKRIDYEEVISTQESSPPICSDVMDTLLNNKDTAPYVTEFHGDVTDANAVLRFLEQKARDRGFDPDAPILASDCKDSDFVTQEKISRMMTRRVNPNDRISFPNDPRLDHKDPRFDPYFFVNDPRFDPNSPEYDGAAHDALNALLGIKYKRDKAAEEAQRPKVLFDDPRLDPKSLSFSPHLFSRDPRFNPSSPEYDGVAHDAFSNLLAIQHSRNKISEENKRKDMELVKLMYGI